MNSEYLSEETHREPSRYSRRDPYERGDSNAWPREGDRRRFDEPRFGNRHDEGRRFEEPPYRIRRERDQRFGDESRYGGYSLYEARPSDAESFEHSGRQARPVHPPYARPAYEHGGFDGGRESQYRPEERELRPSYPGGYESGAGRYRYEAGRFGAPAPHASPGYGTGGSQGERWADAGARARHFGKGPKSYSRSDNRVVEDLCERLERHGEIDASNIEVQCEKGVATLSGTVDDRRVKWLAEECAADVFGVRDVMNRIRVEDPARSAQASDRNSDDSNERSGRRNLQKS